MNKKITLLCTMVLYLFINQVDAHVPTQKETPFVVIVPSYNNARYYDYNLSSIFSQEYDNYRVIYIDDCSTDGTAQLVRQYIKDHNRSDVVTLICNDTRRGALFNTWQAAWQCKDNEVIIILDGDDWFAHTHAMERINQEYKKGAKITYGTWKTFPHGQKGHSKPFTQNIIDNNLYRHYSWVIGAPRTFYAGLFKSIALKDLLYNGDFFIVVGDVAYMFPILEMAHGNITHISDQIYIYNNETPINDHKVRVLQQIHCDNVIRSRKKYTPKNTIFSNKKPQTIEVILHATSPEQLIGSIANVKNFISGYDQIRVIHAHDHNYDFIKQVFVEIEFHSYEDNFKQILSGCLQEVFTEYVLCLDDSYCFTSFIDCKTCVEWMQKTKAYAFSLAPLSVQIKRKTALLDDVIAWQLRDSAHNSRLIGQWSAALYARDNLVAQIESVEYDSYATLQQNVSCAHFDPTDIVLSFDHNKK